MICNHCGHNAEYTIVTTDTDSYQICTHCTAEYNPTLNHKSLTIEQYEDLFYPFHHHSDFIEYEQQDSNRLP